MRVGLVGLLILSFSAVACGEDPSIPAGPTGDRFTLSGTVYEYGDFGRRPLSNAPLDVSRTSDSRIPFSMSDATGRYSATAAGNLEYKVRVDLPAFRQPCFAGVVVTGDRVLDVHVVAGSTLASSGLPASYPVAQPAVSGRVFEITAQGERPIAGASVIADFADPDFTNSSVPAATTLTDTEGRYVLCNVRTGIGLIVTTAGFRQTSKGIDLARTSTYDFELTRTPASGFTPAR